MKTESIQERWCREAKDSDLGLWWLADDVRVLLGPRASEAAVRKWTLNLVKPLLQSGKLRAVDLQPHGQFLEWSGDVTEQLAIISKKWNRLGRSPRIGDIVTFIGPRCNRGVEFQ